MPKQKIFKEPVYDIELYSKSYTPPWDMVVLLVRFDRIRIISKDVDVIVLTKEGTFRSPGIEWREHLHCLNPLWVFRKPRQWSWHLHLKMFELWFEPICRIFLAGLQLLEVRMDLQEPDGAMTLSSKTFNIITCSITACKLRICCWLSVPNILVYVARSCVSLSTKFFFFLFCTGCGANLAYPYFI